MKKINTLKAAGMLLLAAFFLTNARAADANIKEAKVNGFVGSEVGAFHIKPVQKINGRDNFNFAPATRSKAESQLIIRMIQF